MKSYFKKSLAILLAMITAFSIFSIAVTAEDSRQYVITDDDALRTKGEIIVNAKGEEVFLRGINLGGWLIQESWFCPINSLYEGKKGDLNTLRIFEERFGLEKTYELFNIYQDNFIVETDFMNIAAMGFNCVRIPFWYRNFQSDNNGTWIRDEHGEIDLSRLEWAVDMCRKYGLYAILDLHAANGVQGYADHAGLTKSYHFFDRTEKGEWYRQQAVELWKVVAERFKGDPAVAMFDLLNEPMCDTNALERIHKYIWEFYDMAYDAIRAIDPNRMITMIGTWSVDKLPDPKDYGWKNVVYQYHQYDKKESDYTKRIAAGYACGYNVPQFAGEFHPKDGNVTLDFAINAYDSNNISWTLWTYKGYNTWACWSDWFVYGANKNNLVVDPLNDSFETIAYKWGEQMQTNSGNFHPAKAYDVAKKYLPVEPLESVPYKNQYDVDNYVPGELVKSEYPARTNCGFCKTYTTLAKIPIIGDILRWFHSFMHTKIVDRNIAR